MSAPKQSSLQAGFTLVELLVTIIVIAIISTTFLTFFKSSLFGYLNLQSDSSNLTNLQSQASRIANVLRGTTGITQASANELTGYAYFYPSDTYVSLIHYYLQASSGVTKVMADVTPMSANPPTGSPLTSSVHTYTIISNYYQTTSTDLFTYLTLSGSSLSEPITDLATIKGVRVSLAARSSTASGGGNQVINVQVALRNRKTNL